MRACVAGPRVGRRPSRARRLRPASRRRRGRSITRVVQRGGLDRLGQLRGDHRVARGRGRRPTTRSRSGRAWRAARRRIACGQGEAVHLGHVEVEDREVERRRPRGSTRAPRPASGSSRGCIAQRSSWAARIRRFVALSSTTSTRRPATSTAIGRRCGRRELGLVDADRQVERAALARDPAALRRQRAVHELGEAAADREPEARAAVAPRDRDVHLAERPEQPAHRLGRDADARCRGRRP